MPLYMDKHHHIEGLTAEAVAGAHKRDLEVQDKYDADFRQYWFSVSDEEQERRFQNRIQDPTRRWKISPMDLQSRSRWVEYSKAKDAMFLYTNIEEAPWWVVEGDDKARARLNCISHLLSMVPYEDLTPQEIKLPPRQIDTGYVRPPREGQKFVPEVY